MEPVATGSNGDTEAVTDERAETPPKRTMPTPIIATVIGTKAAI